MYECNNVYVSSIHMSHCTPHTTGANPWGPEQKMQPPVYSQPLWHKATTHPVTVYLKGHFNDATWSGPKVTLLPRLHCTTPPVQATQHTCFWGILNISRSSDKLAVDKDLRGWSVPLLTPFAIATRNAQNTSETRLAAVAWAFTSSYSTHHKQPHMHVCTERSYAQHASSETHNCVHGWGLCSGARWIPSMNWILSMLIPGNEESSK